jgi:hypothetical protein
LEKVAHHVAVAVANCDYIIRLHAKRTEIHDHRVAGAITKRDRIASTGGADQIVNAVAQSDFTIDSQHNSIPTVTIATAKREHPLGIGGGPPRVIYRTRRLIAKVGWYIMPEKRCRQRHQTAFQ